MYNETNSFLFVNATKIYQSKARDSEIKDYALCLGNISKDITTDNIFFPLILILMILTIL